MDDTVEVELSRVIIQDKADHQYIHLREKGGSRWFPILIGFNEAWEIQNKLLKFRARRPMTHDLIGNLLDAVDAEVVRVVITELKESTFFAVLVVQPGDSDEEREVDCRPSDAIAVAVQLGAPIYCARDVLDSVSQS